MRVVIIGAGITGRLAQHLLPGAVMLEGARRDKHTLTRMFGTNYLWRPIPGYRCRSFMVVTHVDGRVGTRSSIERYKRKIRKPEDIGKWGLQFEEVMVGFDFVEPVMFDPDNTHFGAFVTGVDLRTKRVFWRSMHDHETFGERVQRYDKLISTIPLNRFLPMTELSASEPVEQMFHCTPIYIQVQPGKHELPRPLDGNDIYVNYNSDPLVPWYRECIRGGVRHVEALTKPAGASVELFPGKIRPNPLIEEQLESLRNYDVYCFGRFASWRPNELVHETYDRLLGEVKTWTNRRS